MCDGKILHELQAKIEALGAAVNTLSVEASVLQELCAALMAEMAIQHSNPSARLEEIIADEKEVSYAVALEAGDHSDDMWEILVSHAEIRNRAFDHARMALARIMGTH